MQEQHFPTTVLQSRFDMEMKGPNYLPVMARFSHRTPTTTEGRAQIVWNEAWEIAVATCAARHAAITNNV